MDRRTLCILSLVTVTLFASACEEGGNHPNPVVIEKILAVPVEYPLRFVMMGDSRTPGEFPFARLRAQIREFDPAPVFVVDIGDLVSQGTMIEYLLYLAAIDPFPLPFVSVIGNHEMYADRGRENYGRLFGDEDFSFDYASCRFIALNDAVPGEYGVSDAQLLWLEALLTDPVPPDKFVFMHVPPPLPKLTGGALREGEILDGARAFPNWDAFKDMVEAHGVRIVGLGHIHEYRHHLRNGVHYVVTGGGGAEISDPLDDPPDHGIFHHFVLVTIGADGQSRAEVIKKGDGTEPDSRYTFEFETTEVAP